jgi:hypothetical protein
VPAGEARSVIEADAGLVAQNRHWAIAQYRNVGNWLEHLVYLTPDEAREIEAEMRVLTARHEERTEHPELRPADAIPVEFLTFSYPLLHLLGVPVGLPTEERES